MGSAEERLDAVPGSTFTLPGTSATPRQHRRGDSRRNPIEPGDPLSRRIHWSPLAMDPPGTAYVPGGTT